MDKKLHTSLPSSDKNADQGALPHDVLLQSFIEDDYAAELNFLKENKLQPRTEAVVRLLQLIGQQHVAEQH